MSPLYDFGLLLYELLIRISSVFSRKIRTGIRGRKNWKRHLSEQILPGDSWVWFHCASMGEFEDGRIFIAAFKKKFPEYKILITFYSPSGYEARRDTELADFVCYLPLDYSFNARHFVQTLQPRYVFFVRNDIWHHFLSALKIHNIPVFFISCLLTDQSGFFKPLLRKFYGASFICFNAIFAQDEKTRSLLEKYHGIKNVHVTGNTRIDAVMENALSGRSARGIEEFTNNGFCVCGGSLLSADIEVFIEAFRSSKRNIKWILVPHEIQPARISSLMRSCGDAAIKYSDLELLRDEHRLLIIDCVGILPFIYRHSKVAFIGGGFNRIGIHNILEPCVFGNTILTGPNTRSYPESTGLSDQNILHVVKSGSEMGRIINEYYDNPSLLIRNAEEAKSYLERNAGASTKAMEITAQILNASKKPATVLVN